MKKQQKKRNFQKTPPCRWWGDLQPFLLVCGSEEFTCLEGLLLLQKVQLLHDVLDLLLQLHDGSVLRRVWHKPTERSEVTQTKQSFFLRLPFFVALLEEICWEELRLRSRIPRSTPSPLSSMLSPEWGCTSVDLPIYGLRQALPFTPALRKSTAALSAGITVGMAFQTAHMDARCSSEPRPGGRCRQGGAGWSSRYITPQSVKNSTLFLFFWLKCEFTSWTRKGGFVSQLHKNFTSLPALIMQLYNLFFHGMTLQRHFSGVCRLSARAHAPWKPSSHIWRLCELLQSPGWHVANAGGRRCCSSQEVQPLTQEILTISLENSGRSVCLASKIFGIIVLRW